MKEVRKKWKANDFDTPEPDYTPNTTNVELTPQRLRSYIIEFDDIIDTSHLELDSNDSLLQTLISDSPVSTDYISYSDCYFDDLDLDSMDFGQLIAMYFKNYNITTIECRKRVIKYMTQLAKDRYFERQ